MATGIKRMWTDDQLVLAVKSSDSIRGVLRQLRLFGAGSNYRTIKRHMTRLSLDTSQWMGKSHLRGKSAIWAVKPIDSVLVENSTYSGNTSSLKKRLIRLGLLKNECCECKQATEWKGKPLVMVLDHINGVNTDNRIRNLRLLCPNCNSQQSTFAGRNIRKDISTSRALVIERIPAPKVSPKIPCPVCGGEKNNLSIMCKKCRKKNKIVKVVRPSYEDLKKMMKEMSICSIGRKYGVSDNAVRKWIKSYEKEIVTSSVAKWRN